MDEKKFYGFNFLKGNLGGLGAAVHALLLALHYAKCNNLEMALIEEGIKYPRFNGSINDIDEEDKNWHSYFKSFPIIKEEEAVAVWPKCPKGWNDDPPISGKNIDWYSTLAKEVYLLRDDIEQQVEELVNKSGFDPLTDVVLHIRRTDKIFASKGSIIESGELPLDVYVKETVKIVKSKEIKCRVFLCTNDKKIYPEIKNEFDKYDIDVIWDDSESELPLHAMYMRGELNKSDAWKENLDALKNFAIMARGLHLIGGRMSYFFRIPELLRYPLPSKNIKDNDKMGKAPYAEKDEHFKNPFLPRRYLNFVSDQYLNKSDAEWNNYANVLEKYYIINIPNFMNPKTAELVINDIKKRPNNWWTHAIRPDENNDRTYKSCDDQNLQKYIDRAQKAADNGLFSYHFQRINGPHYSTCDCFSCRLVETMSSYEVMSILSKITGKTVTNMEETFVSKYVKNNFLTVHHDKNKGNYTFILSLTKDWNPVHGGLTHFCDSEGNIYKTVTPRFNNLIIFKLSPERQMDHFVSQVCGPNVRYAYTGWFSTL